MLFEKVKSRSTRAWIYVFSIHLKLAVSSSCEVECLILSLLICDGSSGLDEACFLSCDGLDVWIGEGDWWYRWDRELHLDRLEAAADVTVRTWPHENSFGYTLYSKSL
jgi:hypothetical protein